MRIVVIAFLHSHAWAFSGNAMAEAQELEQNSRQLFEQITSQLYERLPGIVIRDVGKTPIDGIYQVSLDKGVIYISSDGRYVFNGKLIDLELGRDLTELVVARQRLEQLAAVPESDMIIYEPRGDTTHTITTFTDVDCPYCRKMHREMSQLNDAGVRVRYLLYPRTGVGSPSYKKAVSVWCADDQRVEMDLAKAGETPKARECPNPVNEHIALGQRLGLTGTPMTITDTGERIVGYVPAQELVRRLETTKLAQQNGG